MGLGLRGKGLGFRVLEQQEEVLPSIPTIIQLRAPCFLYQGRVLSENVGDHGQKLS